MLSTKLANLYFPTNTTYVKIIGDFSLFTMTFINFVN